MPIPLNNLPFTGTFSVFQCSQFNSIDESQKKLDWVVTVEFLNKQITVIFYIPEQTFIFKIKNIFKTVARGGYECFVLICDNTEILHLFPNGFVNSNLKNVFELLLPIKDQKSFLLTLNK